MKNNQKPPRISEKHLEAALAWVAHNPKAQMPDTEDEVTAMLLSLKPVRLTEEQIGKFEHNLRHEIQGPNPGGQPRRNELVVKSKVEFKRRLRESAANSFSVAELSHIVDGIALKYGKTIRPSVVKDKLHGSVIKFEIHPSQDLIYLKADEVFDILKKNGRIATA
jgi:hypothetical protein